MSDEYVIRKNISRFNELLREPGEEVRRRTIEQLLVKEEAKLFLLYPASPDSLEQQGKELDRSPGIPHS
jgi:hypothetical protein